jgi:hypothetical protein
MRILLSIQGIYYLVTGIWPLVSLQTFEAVTGPKTDDWLVQTVGVLAATIGATLLIGCVRDKPSRETLSLSVLAALAFTGVDVVFVALGVISRIYLVDAAAQVLALIALASTLAVGRRAGPS